MIEGKPDRCPATCCGQPVERASPAERLAQWRQQVPQVETDHDGLADRDRPQRRGPRGAADLRPRLPRARGGGRRRAVVHDRLRAGLAPHRLDGAAGRPRPGPRGAADPGPLPGQGHRPAARGAARPDPPRDALRRGGRRSRSAAGASTTARPTPRPLFVMLLGRAAPLGPGPPSWSTSCCPTPTGPWSGSRDSATSTATATSSTTGPPTGGWPTRGGRTAGTGSATPTAGWPRRPSPCARCRPTSTAPTWPGPTSPPRPGTATTYDRYRGQGDRPEGRLQPGLLAGGPGLVRRRASTPTSGRSTRSPPTSATACGPGSSTRTRPAPSPASCSAPEMFTGWGVRTLATLDGRLQPGQLPLRFGVAARHGHRRRRAGPLRLRGARPSAWSCSLIDAATAQGGRLPELFSGLDRTELSAAGGLPDLVLAPGVVGGVAAAVPAHPAAPRPLGPLRQDLVGPDGPAGDRPAAGGGDPAGRIAGRRRGGRRLGQRGGAARRDRAHREARGTR